MPPFDGDILPKYTDGVVRSFLEAMISRLVVILSLLLHPALLVGASACGTAPRGSAAAHNHSCCCGDACPAVAPTPSMCGCCDSETSLPEGQVPTAPQVRLSGLDLALAPSPLHVQLPLGMRCGVATPRGTRPAVTSASTNAILCIWLT